MTPTPPKCEQRNGVTLFHGVHHPTKAEDVGVIGLTGPAGTYEGTTIKISMAVSTTKTPFDTNPNVTYFEGDIEHIKRKLCHMVDSLYRTALTIKES